MAGWSLRGPLAAFLLIFCVSRILVAEEGTLAQSLQLLAGDGMKGTPEGLKTAEAAYHRAKRLAPDDGCVDYAWSLVLTRHRKFADAEEAGQKSLGARRPSLAAHTGELRSRLRGRKHEAAADQLVEIAELVGSAGQDQIPLSECRAAADCLGRAYAFLTGPLGNSEIARTVEHREPALRAHLGPLAMAFDEGRRAFGLEHRKLQDDLAILIESAEEQKVEALREGTERLSKVEADYRSAAAEATASQRLLTERVADLDAKLTGLQKRFKNLNETEQTLVAALASLNLNRLMIQQDLDRVQSAVIENPRLQSGGAEVLLNQKLAALAVETEWTRNSLTVVQGQLEVVVRTATSLMQQRAAGYAAQQRVSGASAQLSANLQQWQRTLQEKSRKLAETPVDKTKRLQAVRMKIQSWGSYDRNDPAQELAAIIAAN